MNQPSIGTTIKSILALSLAVAWIQGADAQDQQDPASASAVIQQTLNTIREVEKLNQYIEQNNNLKNENNSLKQQIASLTKQVAQLTKEIQTQTQTLRQQLLALPQFEVKSKLIGPDSARAVLDVGGKMVRIRENVEMSLPVENGLWTLMKVEKISKDVIQLNFPELERIITIYD